MFLSLEGTDAIRLQVWALYRWGWWALDESQGQIKNDTPLSLCSGAEGRESSGQGADFQQVFKTSLAASSSLITDQSGQSVQGGVGHHTDAGSRQGGWSWTWMKLPIEYLWSLAQVWILPWGANLRVWLEPEGQLLSRTLQNIKTHWSALDGKTPHIHLKKQIHLEHNKQNCHDSQHT